MPCTADKLADMLDKIDKPLLVYDGRRRETSNGGALDAAGLDEVVLKLRDPGPFHFHGPEWLENRVFSLSWVGKSDVWVLVEDLRATEYFGRENVIADLDAR